jgi:hypothetical protein
MCDRMQMYNIRDRTMDNVQNCVSCINIPSSQTYSVFTVSKINFTHLKFLNALTRKLAWAFLAVVAMVLHATVSKALTIFFFCHVCWLDGLRWLHLPTQPLSLPPHPSVSDYISGWHSSSLQGEAKDHSEQAVSYVFLHSDFLRGCVRHLFVTGWAGALLFSYSLLAGSTRKKSY